MIRQDEERGCGWNADVKQFFVTAAAAAAAAAASSSSSSSAAAAAAVSLAATTPEDFIEQFVARQEWAENAQDLAMVRLSYIAAGNVSVQQPPPTTQKGWTSETLDAVLLLWHRQQQKQQPLPPPSSAGAAEKEVAVTVRQVYVAFWPAACLLGMILVVLQFVLFYRGQGNGVAGMPWTEDSMTKHSAMLLTCIYSALAWTLSNGLIMNPKKRL